jgi:hypothetical protein
MFGRGRGRAVEVDSALGEVEETVGVEPTRGRRVDSEDEELRNDGRVRPVHATEEMPRARRLDPVEPVALFDLGDARHRSCTRCGSEYESRVPACPTCQTEHREMLIQSMSTIQRAGYVIGRQTDTVEVTASARQALDAPDHVATLRKAPVFVQYKDMLALRSRNVAGYAVVRGR